jgi:hypothetical protein
LGNYNITYNTANFTISKKGIAVTAGAKTKVAGTPDPALTYQVTSGSLAAGDSLTGSLTRAGDEAAGTYAIQQGTLTAGSNYNLTYIEANLTITPPPGRMEGNGGIDQNGKRRQFEFQVRERASGQDWGRVEYRMRDNRPGHDRDGDRDGDCDDDRDDDRDDDHDKWQGRVDSFVSTAVTDVVFSDDPTVRPGRASQPTVDTVEFQGKGLWNGKRGYTFRARATDAGEPGRGRDNFSLTILDENGETVAWVSGSLNSGNIQSSRIAVRSSQR